MKSFDIVIIGGNIISYSIACGLKNSGLNILIIETKEEKLKLNNYVQLPTKLSFINSNSEFFLKTLKVWSNIISIRSCAYQGIEIWNKDKINILSLDSKQNYKSYLGYIIEDKIIHDVLYNNIKICSNINFIIKLKIEKVYFFKDQIFIKFTNGDLITSKLLIITNKNFNFIFEQAEQISRFFWESNYHCLMFYIKTNNPHRKIIINVLCNDGNIFCLPTNDPFLYCIFWSLPSETAKILKNLSTISFNKKLSEYLNMRLGLCNLVGNRKIISLKLHYAKNFVDNRLVLIGNAAYNVYESSSQEKNLYLEDAKNLVNEINNLHKQNKDFGKYIYLRKYERMCKYNSTINLIKLCGFYECFTKVNLIESFLLDLGFKFINNSLYIKNIIMRNLF